MNKPGIIKKSIVDYDSFRYLISIIFILIITVLSHQELQAQGNLLINPRRVVFDGTKRSQELNLVNTGKDTAKYNVSIVQYRMKEDGSFLEINTPEQGENFADKFIRFFPRTVTLAPNEAQVVKMQLIRTDQLKPGEYRSHVYFRAVPKQTALGTEEKQKDSTAIGVKLIPIFGITIPVIIRSGESTMKVALSDLKLDIINDTIPRLQFVFNRTGNMSVYGDILVEHISSLGIAKHVGSIKGIAVYTPNPVRKFQMDLDNKAKVDYHSGSLKITYSAQSDTKPEKYTEADLKLQ
jgi:P pilus assembly chaperone PapD